MCLVRARWRVQRGLPNMQREEREASEECASTQQRYGVINPESHDADADLERQIDFQHGLLVTATNRNEQLAAQDELMRLISQRSPEQVEQMERAMRIR